MGEVHVSSSDSLVVCGVVLKPMFQLRCIPFITGNGCMKTIIMAQLTPFRTRSAVRDKNTCYSCIVTVHFYERDQLCVCKYTVLCRVTLGF